jgi:hypothetical protein
LEKLKRFLSHRRWLALLAVAVTAAAILAWAGYDLGQRVDDQPVYQIANDNYSQTVEIPRTAGEADAALTIPLTLPGGTMLYGLRLDIATYDHAFAEGTLYARLTNDYGDQSSTAAIDCVTLKDNTFAMLIFDAPFTADTDEKGLGMANLTIWYSTPDSDPAPLGLWVSEGACTYLDQNGEPLGTALPMGSFSADGKSKTYDATPALQYVIDYSGRWSHRLSLVLGILLFLAVTGGFALLFLAKVKLPLVFLLEALLLGGAFTFVTPPLVAPDEYTHVANCYAMSSTMLGQAATGEAGKLLARSCDAPYLQEKTGDIGIFAYKQMTEHLGDHDCDSAASTEAEIVPGTITPAQRFLYLPQTLGIALARLLGLGFYGMLLAGRLCNLAVYLLLGWLTLRLAPERLTGLFACVLLLPMGLQLGGSFSADTLVIGMIFSYTALCLRCRTQRAGWPQAAGLLLLALLIGPSKAIYLPAVLLCLMIPNENLPLGSGRGQNAGQQRILGYQIKPGTLIKLGAVLLALLSWAFNNGTSLLYATRDVDNVGLTRAALALLALAAVLAAVYAALRRRPRARRIFWGALAVGVCIAVPLGIYKITHMWGGLTPEDLVGSVQANGDSIYTYSVGYICRNVPGTVKLLLRSVESQAALWLQGIVGTALGEPIVYAVNVSWILTVGLVLTLFLCALRREGEPPRLERHARAGTFAVVLAVAALTVLAALTWTPINYTTIFGIQGRYWLPILPLALLLVGECPDLRTKRDLSRGTAFAMVCFTSLVLLQGYGIYAAWQIQ